MSSLGSRVLEAGAEASKDKVVDLRVTKVVRHPKFGTVTVEAKIDSVGVALADATKQIVDAMYQAALDVSKRDRNPKDRMTLIFQHPEARNNEYLNAGNSLVEDLAESVEQLFEKLHDKYDEISLEGANVGIAEVSFFEGLAGATHIIGEGWKMYSKMEDFEIQSSDITFIHREFNIPCGMGPKEQFSNLCVPLAIQCSTIRHLGDDFRLDRIECPFIHVKER